MTDNETSDEFIDGVKEAKNRNVRSTPTIYINSKIFDGHINKEFLEKIIDQEIELLEKSDSDSVKDKDDT